MTGNIYRPSENARAWAEVDLSALKHNVAELRSMLPRGCGIMAVVKANAYGLGLSRISECLQREGVGAYAIATVEEGIELRESGIEGEILVLGYTHPKYVKLLNDYRLAQLVADGAHAKALDSAGQSIHVHVAVDTGLHRMGIDSSDFAAIESLFNCDNMIVDGVATHLASADSLSENDADFTRMQVEKFYAVVNALKAKGYDTGKLHIQASYGIYNYSDVKCDYVRAGIALHGAMGRVVDTNIKPALQPVLSLRARIAVVRFITAGESVSYGRTFTAAKPMKIATVSIGYADGVPRQMSSNGGVCIVNGIKVPILGRICMDLLMADVTEIDSVAPGDVVTFIGKDGDEEICCEDFAKAGGTITNDILCRLGLRLPRVYINGGR